MNYDDIFMPRSNYVVSKNVYHDALIPLIHMQFHNDTLLHKNCINKLQHVDYNFPLQFKLLDQLVIYLVY